ncbi:rho guanine nucleotide exchange factor 18a isoform X1 [Denticeps clupeoides]|uniref:Uncharacterized protein n=1 Tax=Denticeps clupeoides TaxID=299321 RepID=A0AAY4BHB1_9TELE|nr:rho guanine nucleotide exchange factor 18-like isoform X1 [Denticeps clupeoides]XP_028832068.1 rho guanine nucleotide exchange factor 18-like isoform X1 [Denticeps clupeoides]XP_028832069.1 rho guanine nucleotide exchange factor 18-like isoform X1 [Denticeps clupeoides]XP_028832070.1 rho guanine nucleotide exchange factor 18-like isoform X1 [Denticeps clupeoides]XP_028832071.1 rho guanine nucleotide exchange factor 18-like isoform X1 [Denticeps clupeoides]
MDELDGGRSRPEDSVVLPSAEPISIEDGQYATLRAALENDAQGFEVETWGLAVDPQYMSNLSKEAAKRQEVIYELIQTEINYVRTLKIMQDVFVRELRESLRMDEAKLKRLVPPISDLLQIHQHFLQRLKERRQQALEPGSERNYCIQHIGDLLISQFSEEIGDFMKERYGAFCSGHNDAVNLYKDQLQSNKKFQYLMRKISQHSIVRRLEVPTCILMVTQRITKYPVLVERIIKNTEANTQEHQDLVRALALIKETIMKVDSYVNDHEKAQHLLNRLDPKSLGRMKDGRVFSRDDVMRARSRVLHEGTISWKVTSGKLKAIVVVVLSDVLLLLQEKDQKLVFSTVDNKPSVISLNKLIVRDVALYDRAMYLICDSSDGPEMYEFHMGSREERDHWYQVIWNALESFQGEPGEDLLDEQEEDLPGRLKDLQERLCLKDAQITQRLQEKLQIVNEMTDAVKGAEDAAPHLRLLLQSASNLQGGEELLRCAVTDLENVQKWLIEDSGGAPPSPANCNPNPNYANRNGGLRVEGEPRERSQRASSDPMLKEVYHGESLEQSADGEATPSWDPVSKSQLLDRLQGVSQKLYSLQAALSCQETTTELQRAYLSERAGRPRGNLLLEQEKQRNLEKQKEELARFHQEQQQLRQEQARWEQDRAEQRRQAEALDAELGRLWQRLEQQEGQLAREREELSQQRQTYQQDLERLRESTRSVEKDREKLEQQQQKLWRNKSPAAPGPLQLVADDSSSIAGVILARPSLPPSLRDVPADPGPEVPPRRESIAPSPTKLDVPVQLISTTNQAHKQHAVQQQIPKKLAIQKGKEKAGKVKGHQRTNSAASIEVAQLIPIKAAGKEGGSLRALPSVSSPRLHLDTFVQPEKLANTKPSYTASMNRKANQWPATDPPAHSKKGGSTPDEEIMYL